MEAEQNNSMASETSRILNTTGIHSQELRNFNLKTLMTTWIVVKIMVSLLAPGDGFRGLLNYFVDTSLNKTLKL